MSKMHKLITATELYDSCRSLKFQKHWIYEFGNHAWKSLERLWTMPSLNRRPFASRAHTYKPSPLNEIRTIK